jgi:hypothetical protein
MELEVSFLFNSETTPFCGFRHLFGEKHRGNIISPSPDLLYCKKETRDCIMVNLAKTSENF